MAEPQVLPAAVAEPLYFRDAHAYEVWLQLVAVGPPVMDEIAMLRHTSPVNPVVDTFTVPAEAARFQLRQRRQRRRR